MRSTLISRRRPAGLADRVLCHIQARVSAALPVDNEGERVVQDIDNDPAFQPRYRDCPMP
jgi:hypothetical protein